MRYETLAARALVAAALLVGCRAHINEGVFACATDTDCPAGFLCRADGHCWTSYDGSIAPRDGGRDAQVAGDAERPLDAPMDAGRDAGCEPATDIVDLLLVMDNSNSMAEEQAAFTREIPRFVRNLAAGDRNGDGTPDFAAVRSLRVGVVTSDMGARGNSLPTCGNGAGGFMTGDDGILQTRGAPIAGCDASYPAVFEFLRGSEADAFAARVACVAAVGTGGCGFEQQLDAALKALSPSAPQPWTAAGYRAPAFFAGTGHADGRNAGFVRDGSTLAIVLVTDEEDCSVLEPDLLNISSARYTADLNLRCFTYRDAVHPIERYVDGFLALRRSPRRVVFAGIVGIPLAVVGRSYDAMLAHPDMEERIDPMNPNRLLPSCSTAAGLAFPPRRIVSTARDLTAAGASTSIQSICQSSFTSAVDGVLGAVAETLRATCL